MQQKTTNFKHFNTNCSLSHDNVLKIENLSWTMDLLLNVSVFHSLDKKFMVGVLNFIEIINRIFSKMSLS